MQQGINGLIFLDVRNTNSERASLNIVLPLQMKQIKSEG